MLIVIGVLLLIIAIVLGFWLDKQRFNRKNCAGVEIFKDYKHKVLTGFEEGAVQALGMILGLAGILCIVGWFMGK